MTTAENTEKSRLVETLPGNLRDPSDLPDADVVIFDGNCNFCRAQVKRLDRFSAGKLAFMSLHDDRVGQRYPELTHDQLMQRMYVVTPDRKFYDGASAVRYLSRRLPRLWFVAPLVHIPFSLPIWHFLYDQVARQRYRLGGTQEDCVDGACELHLKK